MEAQVMHDFSHQEQGRSFFAARRGARIGVGPSRRNDQPGELLLDIVPAEIGRRPERLRQDTTQACGGKQNASIGMSKASLLDGVLDIVDRTFELQRVGSALRPMSGSEHARTDGQDGGFPISFEQRAAIAFDQEFRA
jgi:hypothetical protein